MPHARVSYETAAHRMAQAAIIDEVATAYGCVPLVLPTFAPIDALLVQGSAIIGALEVKRRHIHRATFPTCWVEQTKVDALLAVRAGLTARPRQWRALFAVRWHDATGVIDVTQAQWFPLVQRSLRDPRDDGDVADWVFDVDVAAFRVLGVQRSTVVIVDDGWTLT